MKRAGLAAVALLAGIGAASLGPATAQEGGTIEPGSVDRGAQIFLTACATCHGSQGEGTANGPPIADAGEASADFQLRTGRMPRAQPPGGQSLPKPPAFGEQAIRDLVAYVGSLGDGPAIPEVDPSASLSTGMELFVANCAPCHGATAAGGAVGGGWLAPALDRASPRIVAEAMLTGPGQMPVFDLPSGDLSAVAAYVEYLRTAAQPGGLSIGNIGPVPEGFVAWFVGMGLLGLLAYLVGREWTRAA
jgi:ubiquinol-cytochrome c reductase cytochrome c subunit